MLFFSSFWFLIDFSFFLSSFSSSSLGPLPAKCCVLLPLQEVHKRRYLLQQTALEVFLTNGTTIFFCFHSTEERERAFHKFLDNNLPSLVDYGDSVQGKIARESITENWAKGKAALSTNEQKPKKNKKKIRKKQVKKSFPKRRRTRELKV
jgi:hypothetical protein